MITIGVTGGVASGKSLVARILGDMGAVVLGADEAGHALLAEPEVKEALRSRWGEAVFAPDGSVDRAAVAALVFSSDGAAENRRFLESVLHPRIGARLRQQSQEAGKQGVNVFVLDAALLLEAGWDEQCDVLVFVDTPQEVRRHRALGRGWTAEQFADREAAQLDVVTKRHRADAVIANSGDVGDLKENVQRFWKKHVAPRL